MYGKRDGAFYPVRIPHPTKHNFAALRKILKGPNSKLAVASDTGFMD